MKKFVVRSLALVAGGMIGPAMAADIPVKAVSAVTVPSWTGFYLGAGVGYGMWAADTQTVSPATGACVLCFNQIQGGEGWLATVTAGYDYQISPGFLIGIFGDAELSDIEGTIQDQQASWSGDISQESAWAVGARAGWLASPAILLYANAGYTRAHFSDAAMVTTGTGGTTGFSTPSFDVGGWFVGAGTEVAFAPGWSWRTEYRFAQYDAVTLPDCTSAGLCVSSIRFEPSVQTVRSQLIYKFNAGMERAMTASAAPGPIASWSGFYLGVGVGGGMWAADTQILIPTTGACILCVEQKQGGKGWLATISAGYDFQIAPRFMAGVFGDFDFSDLDGTIQDQGPLFAGDISQERAWAVGGRLGWLATPAILSYVNAGYARAHFSDAEMVLTTIGAPLPFRTPSFDAGGWFFGGGAEVAVAPGWTWKNEYRLARYDSTVIPDCAFGVFCTTSIKFEPSVQTVRSSLVYRFN